MHIYLGYPGLPPPDKRKSGNPGFPRGTQWQADGIQPQRLPDGQHLLYTDATTPGNSGSPIFLLKDGDTSQEAFVLAVHVGGVQQNIANCAIPISYHINVDHEYPQ